MKLDEFIDLARNTNNEDDENDLETYVFGAAMEAVMRWAAIHGYSFKDEDEAIVATTRLFTIEAKYEDE